MLWASISIALSNLSDLQSLLGIETSDADLVGLRPLAQVCKPYDILEEACRVTKSLLGIEMKLSAIAPLFASRTLNPSSGIKVKRSIPHPPCS